MFSIYKHKKNTSQLPRRNRYSKVSSEKSSERIKAWMEKYIKPDDTLRKILRDGSMGNSLASSRRDISASKQNIYIRTYLPDTLRVTEAQNSYKSLHLEKGKYLKNSPHRTSSWLRSTYSSMKPCKVQSKFERLIYSTDPAPNKKSTRERGPYLSFSKPKNSKSETYLEPYVEPRTAISRERNKNKEKKKEFRAHSKVDVWDKVVKKTGSLNNYKSEQVLALFNDSKIYKKSNNL